MAYTTINKSSDYFNTKLYTGNGAASRAITGVGFQPDFTWVKDLSVGYNHVLWDVVRTSKAALYTNSTDAEDTSTSRTLVSFDSDGFTLPNVTGDIVNDNGTAYVNWNWKANGAGSANTTGSLDSTVSANTTAGFSIVSWTGNGSTETIGHGLGSVPKMIITKSRTNGADWWGTYHHSLGNNKAVFLNDTAAEGTRTYWANSSPTANVFYVSSERSVNGNGENLIAYCFAEKQGFSKFGRYDGNNSDDGPFIYTGFKPAFVIIKSYSTNPWIMLDNKRGSYNVNQSKLFADASSAENNDTSNGIDFLSNGLKIRRNNSEINASGTAYIYMTFAEAPLVGTNNVPATAR
jgi:hypothetical protein